jgi:hypothetical protein
MQKGPHRAALFVSFRLSFRPESALAPAIFQRRTAIQ